jgi:hypothetical protein
VLVSAVTLTEMLRGGHRDASCRRDPPGTRPHPVSPVSRDPGRRAGEILGVRDLSGCRHAIDAIVAATALDSPRPVMPVTGDPDDLRVLIEEPRRPARERIVVFRV